MTINAKPQAGRWIIALYACAVLDESVAESMRGIGAGVVFLPILRG